MFVISFHKTNPLLPGINKEELLKKLQLDDDRPFFNYMLKDLNDQEVLMEESGIISSKSHKVQLSDEDEKIRKKMLQDICQNQFDKLLKIDNVVHNQKDKTILGILLQKDVVILRDNFLISKKCYDKFIKTVDDHFNNNKTLNVKELKDMLNMSRKSAITLLETLDIKGYTKRIENDRVKVKDFK